MQCFDLKRFKLQIMVIKNIIIFFCYFIETTIIYVSCCVKLGFGENIDWVSYKEGVSLSKKR